jgi:hypothetical protein
MQLRRLRRIAAFLGVDDSGCDGLSFPKLRQWELAFQAIERCANQ